ncbi:MAG: ABC transporter ATP-binding protein [Bacteroidota bacterium]
MSQPLLQVKDLTLSFGEREVLSRLSLVVSPGERIALLGESGSGKSLTALSLLGLLPKTCKAQGEIYLNGHSGNLLEYAEKAWRKLRGREIGLIFQEPLTALNPTQLCGQQLIEAARLYLGLPLEEATTTAREWLHRVQLPDHERIMASFPHELSGGQRQRILIAMAMLANPKLLIADEPTTALDTVIESEILQLLHRLCEEEKMALLFITHDLAAARYIAEEAILLKSGETLESGPISRLVDQAETEYGRRLVKHNARLFNNRRWVINELDDKSRALLNMENLSLSYSVKTDWMGRPLAWLKAIDGVSLQLVQGEMLALVGQSGCGKSSLARCISGLSKADHGSIKWADAQAEHQDIVLGQIPMVFQDPFSSLTPNRQVGQQIEEVVRRLNPNGQASELKNESTRLLERVGLDPSEYYSRKPNQLSGGQRQRVAIARALATQPKVLIADEVTSALDAPLRHKLMQLLHQLCREDGLSLLYITHDLALALEWADRIAVMHQGQIVDLFLPAKKDEQDRHQVTTKLLDALKLTI